MYSLSVLIHFGLFCYHTKWIYQFRLHICYCLSVHSGFGMFHYSTEYDLCSDGQLISEGHLVCSKLTSDYLILMVAMNQFFFIIWEPVFLLVTMIFLVSHGNQVFFVVTKVLVASWQQAICLVTLISSFIQFLFP